MAFSTLSGNPAITHQPHLDVPSLLSKLPAQGRLDDDSHDGHQRKLQKGVKVVRAATQVASVIDPHPPESPPEPSWTRMMADLLAVLKQHRFILIPYYDFLLYIVLLCFLSSESRPQGHGNLCGSNA